MCNVLPGQGCIVLGSEVEALRGLLRVPEMAFAEAFQKPEGFRVSGLGLRVSG